MAIQPAFVVLHTMVGTEEAADARFQQPSEQASATYGVKLDGSVVQWVDEADAAWANGATGQGGTGDNLDSISIEHEDNGDYNGPRTPQLYAASAALVRDICTRYNVPIDRQHIIGHRECDFASTACPDALDIDGIVAAAAAGGFSVTTADQINDLWNTFVGFTDEVGPDGKPTTRATPYRAVLWAKLDALLKDAGMEQAGIDALNKTAAAASSVAALAASQAAMKAELDQLAASGIPALVLQPVLDRVATVDTHLAALSAHLGVGTP